MDINTRQHTIRRGYYYIQECFAQMANSLQLSDSCPEPGESPANNLVLMRHQNKNQYVLLVH